MFNLDGLTDTTLLLSRLMAGAVFADSGYKHASDPEGRSKSIGMSKGFTLFLGIAELAGAAGVIAGVLQQLAALGLVLLMLGAVQKKAFVWKTGFWGENGQGWSYELMLITMLLVIAATNGGRYVLLR